MRSGLHFLHCTFSPESIVTAIACELLLLLGGLGDSTTVELGGFV